MDFIFWPIWLTTSILMQRDILKVFPEENQSIKNIGNHFKNQSIYGGIFLLGIIIAS
jgi:4-hydroxybenzoate polyprenyltransferase